MAFEIFQSEKTKKFHFRLKAKNGQVVFTGQGYANKAGVHNGIKSVVNNTSEGDSMFERLIAKNGSPYFTLKAKNGNVIGQSQMYKNSASMEKGIASVIANAQEGKIKDLTA